MVIDRLVASIQELEEELEQAIDEQRQRFEYELSKRRVRFERTVRQRHRQFKTGLFRYLFESAFTTVLFSPLVYILIVPLLLLDAFVTIYQFVCFPVYGIEKAKRSDFIAFDRQHLAYIREIAGRSEEHFCPVKHARRPKGQHPRYWSFAEYGDAQGLVDKEAEITKKSLTRIRKRWDNTDSNQG